MMNPARRATNYLQASTQRHVEINIRMTQAKTKAEVISEIDNNLPRMNFFNLVTASTKLGRLTDKTVPEELQMQCTDTLRERLKVVCQLLILNAIQLMAVSGRC